MNALVSKGLLRTAARRGGPLSLLSAAGHALPPQPAATTLVMAMAAAHARRANSHSALPTIAQPSFWKSLIPKPLRKGSSGEPGQPDNKNKPKLFNWSSKEWNPATFFILIFLFIGSMSINMITLKRDYENFVRQTETKIGLLREVVERIQKGETVDVERILGAGDPEREAEWEAVLKELQRDQLPKKQDKKSAAAAPTSQPVADSPAVPETPIMPEPAGKVKVTSFY